MKKKKETKEIMNLPKLTKGELFFKDLPSAKIEMVNVEGQLVVDKVYIGILSHQWKHLKFFMQRVLPRVFAYPTFQSDKKERSYFG